MFPVFAAFSSCFPDLHRFGSSFFCTLADRIVASVILQLFQMEHLVEWHGGDFGDGIAADDGSPREWLYDEFGIGVEPDGSTVSRFGVPVGG